MKSAKIKLGKTDVLYVTLHPKYLHLKLLQPGKAQFEQNIYIPRRKLVPLLSWIIHSRDKVYRTGSMYPPDRETRYLEQLREHDEALRRQKQEAKRAAQKRSRYLAAKKRARRRRT